MTSITRDTITEMLGDENTYKVMAVIGRALVVLLNNQTSDEQVNAVTSHSNGTGFTGADAYSGTITAKYFLRHKRLEGWQIEMWSRRNNKGVPRLAKYHAQLNIAAQEKAAKDERNQILQNVK